MNTDAPQGGMSNLLLLLFLSISITITITITTLTRATWVENEHKVFWTAEKVQRHKEPRNGGTEAIERMQCLASAVDDVVHDLHVVQQLVS